MKSRVLIIIGIVIIGIIIQSNSVFGQEMEEPEPESIIIDPCDPTVILTNSDICNNSLSPYPIIIIVAFVLIVGLIVYWFTWGIRK